MTTKNPFASCFPGFFTFVQNDKKILFSLFKGRYGEAERDFTPFISQPLSLRQLPLKEEHKRGKDFAGKNLSRTSCFPLLIGEGYGEVLFLHSKPSIKLWKCV